MITAPTVFLVDDDPAVLKSLSRLLRSAGFKVSPFQSAQDFLDGENFFAPGCIVLDVAMPGLDGLALQEALVARNSELPVIFLTGHGNIAMGVHAMKVGATDFLTKPVDDQTLLDAVRTAIEKNLLALQTRAELDDIRQRLATLTPREREVLALVVAGHLNKQAAAELGTVEKTIKVHRARVMAKMKVSSLAELVRLASRAGIVGPATKTG
jgi:FixJ family two-component response regulator